MVGCTILVSIFVQPFNNYNDSSLVFDYIPDFMENTTLVRENTEFAGSVTTEEKDDVNVIETVYFQSKNIVD